MLRFGHIPMIVWKGKLDSKSVKLSSSVELMLTSLNKKWMKPLPDVLLTLTHAVSSQYSVFGLVLAFTGSVPNFITTGNISTWAASQHINIRYINPQLCELFFPLKVMSIHPSIQLFIHPFIHLKFRVMMKRKREK